MPEAGPPDANVDGAVPHFDASIDATTDAAPMADAQVDASDATADATAPDGATCPPPVTSQCAPRAEPRVQCGELVCEGDAALCCKHIGGLSCVGASTECRSDAGAGVIYTGDIVSACDDASDCPEGQICIDSYNKGLGQNDGARCMATCDYAGIERPGYTFQRCANECECIHGTACVDGRCAER